MAGFYQVGGLPRGGARPPAAAADGAPFCAPPYSFPPLPSATLPSPWQGVMLVGEHAGKKVGAGSLAPPLLVACMLVCLPSPCAGLRRQAPRARRDDRGRHRGAVLGAREPRHRALGRRVRRRRSERIASPFNYTYPDPDAARPPCAARPVVPQVRRRGVARRRRGVGALGALLHLQPHDQDGLPDDARVAQGVGVLAQLRPRHAAAVGPAVRHREPVRLDDLHGLLHRGAPAAGRPRRRGQGRAR